MINNVAALALLMPLDIEAAEKARRAVALTLMPLAFATIIGGMITLIGTPPNIVIAQYREDRRWARPSACSTSRRSGWSVAIAGVAFVALVGWRLAARPQRGAIRFAEVDARAAMSPSFRSAKESKSEGTRLRDLLSALADEHDLTLLGLERGGSAGSRVLRARQAIAAGDVLVVEGDPQGHRGLHGCKAELEFTGVCGA
jgi:hypothetical protein